ncbi:MAG: PKD domain-containing protein [Acidithiobacillales bacterium]
MSAGIHRSLASFAPILLGLSLLVAAPERAEAQASARAGRVDNEGCWCGYQTGIVRNYVVRGTGTTADKQAAADMLNEWNRYVRLFNVSVDGGGGLGSRNGVNELNVFISSDQSMAQYGFEMEPGLFGRAVMFPDASFGSFNECVDYKPDGCSSFTETDVVINADFGGGWTPDWYAIGNDQRGGKAIIQATVLHEAGHTLGLHHIFQLEGGRSSFSTMNYSNDDTTVYVTRIDAKSVRAEYPSFAQSLTDIAIYPFTYGSGKYEQYYAKLSKESVTPGEAFTLDGWLIQNVGSQVASNIVVMFYVWPSASGRQYPQPSDIAIGSANYSSAEVDGEAAVNGTPLSVPPSVAAGTYYLGAIVTVNGSEDATYVVGKPSNNRFILGHSPRVLLTVLGTPGGGGAPVADFAVSPVTPLAGQPVIFSDRSRGTPTSWSWSFGDPASGGSNTSTAQNPTHVYGSAGKYTATLQAQNSGGSSTISRTVTITQPAGGGGTSVTRLVPVVIDVRVSGVQTFSTELTLTNRGTTTATVTLRYTAAPGYGGLGTGTTSLSLGPGRQTRINDVIAYLRTQGMGIPSGTTQGGSLRVTFGGLSSADAGFAVARTTAPSGSGRAGLAYSGVDPTSLTSERVALLGLRENSADRSNLALLNAGTGGPVTLRIYLVKGDGTDAGTVKPDFTLGPGEWTQINRILSASGSGWDEAWAIVERVAGSDPFYSYAVFNDNRTSDGSFVPPVAEESIEGTVGVPALVETTRFQSEVTLINPTDQATAAYFEYYESLAASGVGTGLFFVDLGPFEQIIVPGVIDALRQSGAAIGPKGGNYAGPLFAVFTDNVSVVPGLAGARTGAPAASGGQYGLFYTADTLSDTATNAWVYGLQQNERARSNLAIVNAGINNEVITVRVDVYDGDSGAKVGQQTRTLQPGQWTQINSVLGRVRNGYAHVFVLEGGDAFIAYGVVNDGASASTGTDDGSYVPMVKSN